MKKLIEVNDEGFDGMIGEQVMIYAFRFIYVGKLVGVNGSFVKLSGARFVYNTGDHTSKKWAEDAPAWNDEWYIMTGAIESFGTL